MRNLPRKGRGAASNTSGRFEREQRVEIDDGWDLGDAHHVDDQGHAGRLRTEVTAEAAKTIISKNTSPDIPFDQSLNPYRGCEHGCIYCYARPSHAYLGLSPGLDFERRLFAKPNAAELLKRELSRPGYRCQTLQLGANTDPYQPLERRWRISRHLLGVLAACDHPVSITTKSDLVCRDLDLLRPMAAKGLAAVAVSLTTLDTGLARKLEPRAPTPAKRLKAIARLSDAGIPVAVLAAPMIPAINDWELERLLTAAADAGARFAGYILLRLPHELTDLVDEWLDHHAPGKKTHVLNLLRESRGGDLYQATWRSRMTGRGPHADLLAQRFRLASRKLGLNGGLRGRGFGLRTDLFRPPEPPQRPSKRKPAPQTGQMDLFGRP